MRTIVFVAFFLFSVLVHAQRECATSIYMQEQKALHPDLLQSIPQNEQFIRQQLLKNISNAKTTLTKTILRIPVVVHVLYHASASPISEAQVKSQLDALNRDFNRTNSDTINTPQRFKPFAANVQIEFVLASTDPKGRATTGIIRKQTPVKEWEMDDKIKFSAHGGDDAWDSKSYLNIWVGNLRRFLGYASVVGGPANKDGLVITTSAFGTINVSPPYHLGRTVVHEAGHWLGLKHIWGDSYCGDDFVDDTPVQGSFTSGCPSGFRTSCSNEAWGDMYMNYMDFTADVCMNLFTIKQKERMRSLFAEGGPRHSLLFSKGLNAPWTDEVSLPEESAAPAQFQLYPNPVRDALAMNFSFDATWVGKEVSIINISGLAVKKFLITRHLLSINVSSLTKGIYIIEAQNGKQKIRKKIVKL